MFGCTLRPDTISPYSLGTAPWGLSCVGLLLQDIDTPLLSDSALSDRNRNGLQTTDTIVRAGHELVCLVLGWDPSTMRAEACKIPSLEGLWIYGVTLS